MSRKVHPLFYLLLAFALFGLLSFIVNDTFQFIKVILITIGVATILYAIFYLIRTKSGSSGFSSNYHKAVKQSKKKYGSTNQYKQYQQAARVQKLKNNSKRPKRTATHLRVIDGKQDNIYDRALF